MRRKQRDSRKPEHLPRWWIHAAGELFHACLTAHASPERVIARAFRDDGRLVGEARAFVAETVQAMLRARGLIDAGMRSVPGARVDDAVLFFLRARRGIPAGGRDAVIGRAIAAAAKETGGRDVLVPDWLLQTPPFSTPHGHELLRSFSEAPPVTLRTNVLKISPDELAGELWNEGIATQPTHWSPWGLTLERHANVFRTEAFHEGLFEMQDEGSQLIAFLGAAQPGNVVVDGCAGAGGKTLALGAMMDNRGTLYAFDTAEFRLKALRERAARAGVQNLRVHAVDNNHSPSITRLQRKADLVLVDAPCSGTGVLRRHPDIGWRLTEADLERLVAEQAALLDAYAPLVKPGGRLVYAVCSLLPVEGESQIKRFLRDNADFRRVDTANALRQVRIPPDDLVTRGDLLVDPVRHGMDGFYAAVLWRA